jgi:hypothetical protein
VLKFGVARKNVGVWVHTLNLELCGEHTHNMVCTVCTYIIMACVVCAVLSERKGVWLVCVQCGYMLSHDSLVNGAWWGRTKIWHGVMCRVNCAWNINAQYKNCTQQVIVQEPKFCAVDIGARHQSSVHHLLSDREVIHSG